MSLSQTVTWDCQTGGNDTNGGGFNTAAAGTDYSQQVAPQVTFDGATVYATTVGVGATITLVGVTGVAAHVGNIVNITGGTNFVAGRYQITGYTAGTWTLDRNCTTGAGAAMTGKMGGCFQTPAAMLAAQAGTGSVADQVCYLKYGTYNIASTLTPAGAVSLYQSRLSGYYAAHEDVPQGANRPTIATNSNAIAAITPGSDGWRLENLILDGSGSPKGTRGVDAGTVAKSYLAVSNCKAVNFSSHGFYMGGSTLLINCEAGSNGGSGITGVSGLTFVSCFSHDNTVNGFSCGATYSAIRCVAANNGGDGFNSGYILDIIINCVSYKNSGAGIVLASPGYLTSCVLLLNNILAKNGTYGISMSGVPAFKQHPGWRNNAFWSNTSGDFQNWTLAASDVTVTANPFNGADPITTSGGSGDFTLNNSNPGGAQCRATGMGLVDGLTQVGYLDIGSYQHQDAGGGAFARIIQMAERIPQSTTKRVVFNAYLSSDHISAATGKTIAITLSKNGSAYANPSGGATNATEIANGKYYVDLTTTDTNTLGPLSLRGAVATVDDVFLDFSVIDANTGSFGNLDATISSRSTYAGGAATPTDVLTQVNAAFDTNVSELASSPAANATIRQMLKWLFQYFKFKKTVTATTETQFKSDNSTNLSTATISDDGTTFTKGPMS